MNHRHGHEDCRGHHHDEKQSTFKRVREAIYNVLFVISGILILIGMILYILENFFN